jgi:ATP-binding cassette, subfamily A (ABC1), member 3
VIEDAI